jgi:MFS family permease
METNTGAATRGEARPAGDPRARLVTRPLLVRFVSTVGVAASFYLLLSTVPEYARAAGASAGTAGLTTTALTLSSMAAYLVAPRLIARYGYRLVLAAGLAALSLTAVPALVIAGAAVFGAGFGVTQNASLTIITTGCPSRATVRSARCGTWPTTAAWAWARPGSACWPPGPAIPRPSS